MILSAVSTSGMESFFKLMPVLFAFVFVLVLTYFCTRWIAKYQNVIQKNKNIRVLETFRLANNKFIQIIEAGTAYFVIAVSKDSVTLLGKLDKEQLTWIPESDMQTPVVNRNFQDILQKMKEKLPRK